MRTTLISENFSTSKKSAERRCSSRFLFRVFSDAAVMSSRPDTAPVSVTWAVAPDLAEMALDGHQAPHRLVPESEG